MRQTRDLSDRALLRKAAKDNSYLSALVERYQRPLFRFIYRFVGRRETAEDLVQETFLRCLKHRHKFICIEHVSTWLYTIAANLAKTELRRRKRWVQVCIGADKEEEGAEYYEPVDGRPLPDEQADSGATQSQVIQAIGKLPDEYREAVLLRDVKGLSYNEIARISGCPLGTVKSRVNRGRSRLHADLRRLADEVYGWTAARSEVF